ncbi:WXG100 family type VII secretion target [Nocardioides sp. HB32]
MAVGTGHRQVMGTLTTDHQAFRSAVADLRDAASRLTADRDRAARSVDALLGTWSGTVASSYAEGWDAWCAGAARVLEGLSSMATLLESADADFSATDAGAGAELGRLTTRLG